MSNVALPDARLRPRTADPYRNLDVIDTRAPRFNQLVVGSVSLFALLTGWWPLLTLLAVQLGMGLRFGRRYCLSCVAYFELIQPRFGEGELEDSRPPRFANQVGFTFLSLATVAYLAGLPLSARHSAARWPPWRCWQPRPASAWAAGCTVSRHRSSASTCATSIPPPTAPTAPSTTPPRPAAEASRRRVSGTSCHDAVADGPAAKVWGRGIGKRADQVQRVGVVGEADVCRRRARRVMRHGSERSPRRPRRRRRAPSRRAAARRDR